MRYLNDTGFVVKRVNLGEADRFVTILTQNNGKVEVLAKGVRKITSRRASHIELLNLVRFNSVKTSKNFILTEIDLINSFENKKETLHQFEIMFLLCELIDNLCPYGQHNFEVYSSMNDFLQKGDFTDEALMKFETDILIHLGYWNYGRKFTNEKEVRTFIESLIERKIKSRVIGNLDIVT